MSNLLNRAKYEAIGLALDFKSGMLSHSRTNKAFFISGAVLGVMMQLSMVALADQNISNFSSTLVGKLNEIYSASFPVITAIAVISAMFAFVMRMTANQAKAATATSWLIRIAIAYIGVMSVGLLAKVIQGTVDQSWREMPIGSTTSTAATTTGP